MGWKTADKLLLSVTQEVWIVKGFCVMMRRNFVLFSLFVLRSSHVFPAIMLNSYNTARIKAIILLRNKKKQRQSD